jgi:transketolase
VTAASYGEALQSLAARRDGLIVMTAENRAPIRSLPAALGPRFVDVGICEQTLIGAAAGLALRGRTPVAHALAAFLTLRAFEFIRTDVGIARLPVKLVGYVPGFLSEANGPTHQALEDMALMRGIPGMKVVCPADEAELVAALPAIVDDPAPCYVRYNAFPAAVRHREPFAFGKAEVLADGGDVAILTYGFLLREAEAARVRLEEQGVAVRLVNLRTLAPVDEEAIVESVRKTRLTVTVEDHFGSGGLSSIVAEVLLRRRMTGNVHAIHLGERWFQPALLPAVLENEGFTGPRLAARILEALTPPAPSPTALPSAGRGGERSGDHP